MIVTGMCYQFKADMLSLENPHKPTDQYAMVLYTDEANINPATSVYVPDGECPNTGGYTTGGVDIMGFKSVKAGTGAYITFDDLIISNATITARGCMLINKTRGNKALATFDFGANITAVNGDFEIKMPPGGIDSAVLRIL